MTDRLFPATLTPFPSALLSRLYKNKYLSDRGTSYTCARLEPIITQSQHRFKPIITTQLESMYIGLPVFVLCCSVPLAPIFKPIGHLRCGQSGCFGQFTFLSRWRVGIVSVPVAQYRTALLFETVGRLFAVPNCARKWELATDAVLANGSQWTSTQFLGFDIMRL